MTKEEIYDAEIAPVLLGLAKKCAELQMAFIACVEYDPANEGIGRTEFCPVDERGKLSAAQRLTHWAARSFGNLDKLMIACDTHARKHGHSSIYLTMAGNKNVKYDGTETAALTIVGK